ncbi:hypothetical protein ACFC5X_05530 [Streptomyces sp. NPDC055952]
MSHRGPADAPRSRARLTYWYDGDGNLVQRSDGTGTTKYEFDPLHR